MLFFGWRSTLAHMDHAVRPADNVRQIAVCRRHADIRTILLEKQVIPVTLYHDGCSICVAVVENIDTLIDKTRFALRVVNLSEQRDAVAEAEALHVSRLPSLEFDTRVIEIEPHASIAEFRKPELHVGPSPANR
ncbi:conserved hypothetical protein [Paraburkholderia piptadeniae]|uniref:Thioredoxin family protein n=1 Tax=Paraburkholderia piptadeniae TaxID=1701573 RepID=A0A1N7RYP3_9BURK|nr:hypothetical protein [Paraburkholderia piptadeniae]SIT40179.1 conserved hypothetical protein [Paraburkholderia piptadeniae]